jgi:hypothetical protein
MNPQGVGGANSLATSLEGRSGWLQAIASLLTEAGPTICMYSPDYADWPLSRRELITTLDAWGLQRKQPCVRMLARRFDVVSRDQAAFAQWRKRFSHLIACHVLPSEIAAPPECLLLRDHGLLALPSETYRLAAACSGARHHGLLEQFNQAWDQSIMGFPANILGL